MFGFSGTELILVALIALLVINPKDLPSTLKNIRDTLRKIKKTASEFTDAIMGDEQVNDLKKEAQKINEEIHHIVDLNGDMQPTYSLDDIQEHIPAKKSLKVNEPSKPKEK